MGLYWDYDERFQEGTIVQRYWIVGLILALLLTACNTTTETTPEPAPDAVELLAAVVENVRELQSFNMLIEQRGAEYPFSISLDEGVTQITAVMRRGEVQYVSPDEMYANITLRVGGLPPIGLEVFLQGAEQWFKLVGSGWINFPLAEGFDPGQLIQTDSGIPRALTDLDSIEYISEESLSNGTPVHHVRGIASGNLISDLLFGLLTIEQDNISVDVFIDKDNNVPLLLTMTLPDTATEDENADTQWRLEFFDFDAEAGFDRPAEAVRE
ncbi:MAG: LppX_LprAFG lipoprotein [Aggregatilineales bacterium]